MKQASLLFITTQLPYPPVSGGKIKSWNYLKDLVNRYELSLACLLKNGDEAQVKPMQKDLALKNFLAEKIEVKRNLWTLLKSYRNFPCLNVFRNHSDIFSKKLQPMIDQNDILLVDHYEMFQYVPENYPGKVVLHTHNAEFMLWQRMSELEKNPLKRKVLKKEAERVKVYEAEIFDRADLIFATPSDTEIFKKYGFETEKHRPTYHLGNENLLQLPRIQFNETETALTFVGTLNWEPNVDGLIWFLDQVWPMIKQERNEIKFYIIGKEPDRRIRAAAKGDQSVIFTGFVDQLDDYLKKTRVYIAPLRFGSGMKVKVLEGLYRGIPTVTTAVGAEGLDIKNRKEAMIANEAEDFSAACLELMKNQLLWEKLSEKSRKLAAEKYRWKPLFEKMNVDFQEIWDKRET